MTVRLTVHRSTQEIGGNCIEISPSDGQRLLLDIGRPLDATGEATSLLPASLDLSGTRGDPYLASSPDHYGLLQAAPAEWRVYSGGATEKLVKLTAAIGDPITRDLNCLDKRPSLHDRAIHANAVLTDHSALMPTRC